MKLAAIINVLTRHFADDNLRKRAIYIEGASGIGKSDAVRQVADHFGVPMIDLRLSQMAPEDLRGIPSVIKGGKGETTGITVWNRPAFFPGEDQPNGILFLDEITSANSSVMAACYQLVLDRALGEYKLPPGWMVIAAGNRVSDRGVVNQMPAPLLNRFIKLTADVDFDDWKDWAIANRVDYRILGFLHFKKAMLHFFEPNGEIKPFPTPRSWVAASAYAADPKELRYEMMMGVVGEQAASTFETYIRLVDELPTVDAIIKDPEGTEVPENVGMRYAMTGHLVEQVDANNASALLTYMNRMPMEFRALFLRIAEKTTINDTKRTKGELIRQFATAGFHKSMNDYLELTRGAKGKL